MIFNFWQFLWKSGKVKSRKYLSRTDYLDKIHVLKTLHWGHASVGGWPLAVNQHALAPGRFVKRGKRPKARESLIKEILTH